MIRILSCIGVFALGWSNVLTFDIPAPQYEITDGRLTVEGAAYFNPIGAPNVPARIVTIALPPGAIVQDVCFRGAREEMGKLRIDAAQPPMSLSGGSSWLDLQQQYERARTEYYTSGDVYPITYGEMVAKGGLRKYTLITVACFHFAYDVHSGMVLRAPNVTVEVRYAMPSPSSERARFWQALVNDITFDDIAQRLFYNWQDAQLWYHTDAPVRANGYHIIIPAALQGAVSSLAAHRQSQGYDVHIITREYIETNIAGIDTQEKVRNYLRQNMADIEYALLVGFATDMPWRGLVPFNNDPNSPWNHPDYSPIPGDLYLAELTDPDSLSWNSDGDSFYGEVFTESFQPIGDDDPDYHADIHLGRIPFSTQSVIEEICAKLIAFDTNTDASYKTASLLTGALYYYANENNGGNARMDGAEYCEQLLTDSVLPRLTATTLYEKGGLRPCTLACTDSLTQANHIAYWQNKGVMYECHHGNVPLYARKLWAWDDGDSVPENTEITWPTSLYITDVYQLDNSHPATCFLRSCLCGKPEETGLGAMLLYRGGSNVISSSRICWTTSADPGGIPYHFFDRLLQDTTLSRGIIGNAYDIAKIDLMGNTGFWLPAYHDNLFGDPALRQFGQLVGIASGASEVVPTALNIFPNPSRGRVTLSGYLPNESAALIDIYIYDAAGRLVDRYEKCGQGAADYSLDVRLPCGVYFVRCSVAEECLICKVVVIE